jgi:hypothetical protein
MLAKIGAFVTRYTRDGHAYRVWEVPVAAIAPTYVSCTIYLYSSVEAANLGKGFGGSGFVLGVPFPAGERQWHLYAVTNKHVIEPPDQSPSNSVIRVNTLDGSSAVIPTQPAAWTKAIDDDLAVLPFEPPKNWAPGLISTDICLEQNCEIEGWPIYPGDEAIFFGRFVNHEGHQRNKPVVRFGNISMMPDSDAPIKVGDINQIGFLVECRSLGGFSGSPAFVHLDGRRWMDTKKGGLSPSVPRFLGVDCAHLAFWSGVCQEKDPRTRIPNMWAETNSGIAVIVPAWRLLRLINEEHFVKEREREEQRSAKEQKAASAAIPDVTADDEPFTKDDFEQALKTVARKLPDSGTTQTSDE